MPDSVDSIIEEGADQVPSISSVNNSISLYTGLIGGIDFNTTGADSRSVAISIDDTSNEDVDSVDTGEVCNPFQYNITTATSTTNCVYSAPSGYINFTSTSCSELYLTQPTVQILRDDEYYKRADRDRKRHAIKSKTCSIAKERSEPIPKDISDSERTAINTLREEISESEYRRYIKHGFILVKGLSGAVYQIFRSRRHTNIWVDGKIIEEVCVRLSDYKLPPTDSVIALRNIILSDEDEFKNLGNVYKNDGSTVIFDGSTGIFRADNNLTINYCASTGYIPNS